MDKIRRKKIRKVVSILLFVAMNVTVIAVTAMTEFGNSKNAAELSEVQLNWWMLIPALLCFGVASIANIYKYVLMIRSALKKDTQTTNREVWKIAWRVVMLGKYYDNITPAAVGGQPFQIYYMRKNSGLSKGYSTSIPIVGMIVGQIGFLIIALACFIIGGGALNNPTLMVAAWLGLLVYAFWPVMIAGVGYFPKATARFLQFCVKVLAKLHIIKNRDEALEKINDEVSEYAKSTKMILKTRGLFAKIIILATIYNLFVSMIPFFVLTAFGGNVNFWISLVTTVAVTSAVYFVPTPGNSGAAEGTFFVVFSALSSGYIFWAMLVWRFFSYYIYIIMGPLTYLSMHLEKKGIHASKKAKKLE